MQDEDDLYRLRVIINGTNENRWQKFNLKQNPFPQLGKAEYYRGEMQLNSLDGDPIKDAEDIRQRLKGFDPEFIDVRELFGDAVKTADRDDMRLFERSAPHIPGRIVCEAPSGERDGPCDFEYVHTTDQGVRRFNCLTHQAPTHIYPVTQTVKYEYFADAPHSLTIQTHLYFKPLDPTIIDPPQQKP